MDLTKVAIGFTGTGGTGKTTTAKLLAEHFGLPFHTGVSRSVFERRHITEAIQRDQTPKQNLELQMAIFQARQEQIYDNPYGVFDRTLLDHLIYTLYRCGPAVTQAKYHILCGDVLSDLIRHAVIFYCPMVTFRGSSDGFREEGFGYRITIDLMHRAMQGQIAHEDIHIILLPITSLKLRMRFIKQHLETL